LAGAFEDECTSGETVYDLDEIMVQSDRAD
jgi:hypothetical protein